MLLNGVVLGSCVESAYFALVNELHFIPTRKTPYLFYELSDIKIFGLSKKSEIWDKLNLMIGLLSKRIALEETSNIRVSEDIIRIAKGNITFKYQFDNIYIFDPTGIELENEIEYARPKTYRVLDDFELSVLGPRKYELAPLINDDNFAKELHFYCSDRVDGADYITYCVVESELTQEQLNSFDYSDSMVRFVVERHLSSIGVYGRLMKHYTSGKPKYRKPKVLHVKRVVEEKDNNTYRQTKNIKFLSLSLRELIEESTKR